MLTHGPIPLQIKLFMILFLASRFLHVRTPQSPKQSKRCWNTIRVMRSLSATSAVSSRPWRVFF